MEPEPRKHKTVCKYGHSLANPIIQRGWKHPRTGRVYDLRKCRECERERARKKREETLRRRALEWLAANPNYAESASG